MPTILTGLVTANGTVRVEEPTVTQDANGGTQKAWATVATGVAVLISQVHAKRDGRFHGENNTLSGTITSASAHLGRTDTRLYFETAAIPGVSGVYAKVTSVDPHPAGRGGLVGERYSCRWESVQVPS